MRHYTVASMREAMRAEQLDVVDARHVNMPCLAAWYLTIRLLRMTPGDGRLLPAWDSRVIPLARRWEARHRVPFGQSVFAVGRVPVRPQPETVAR